MYFKFQIENMIYYHAPTNNHEIYITILNNKSFKSILREGWNIIYKRRKKNYLKKKDKSYVIIDFLGYANKSKLGKLFSCEISKRAKLIEKGLVIPTKIMKIFLYNIFEKKPLLTKIEIGASSYYFAYERTKNDDEIIENDKINEIKKLIGVKNLRKNNKFRVVIQIPCSTMIFVK